MSCSRKRARDGEVLAAMRERKATRSQAKTQKSSASTKSLALQVMSVFVEAYGGLPTELRDLSKTTDVGAGRTVIFEQATPTAVKQRILTQGRFKVVRVVLGSSFDKPIVLPSTVQHLEIGTKFNRPILLPEGLKSVEIVYRSRFDQQLVLPSTLESFQVAKRAEFNQPLLLPNRLRELEIHEWCRFSADILPRQLPSTLRDLTVGRNVREAFVLPTGLENLAWHSTAPVSIPKNLQSLILGSTFNHRISDLHECTKLKELKIGMSFSCPLSLPEGLLKLDMSGCSLFNHPLRLPDGIVEVLLGPLFNQSIALPTSVKSITFGKDFNQHVDIPSQVEDVKFGVRFNTQVVLPEGLKHVRFGDFFDRPLVLPSTVESAIFGWYFNQRLTVGSHMRKLTIRNDGYSYPLKMPCGCKFALGGSLSWI